MSSCSSPTTPLSPPTRPTSLSPASSSDSSDMVTTPAHSSTSSFQEPHYSSSNASPSHSPERRTKLAFPSGYRASKGASPYAEPDASARDGPSESPQRKPRPLSQTVRNDMHNAAALSGTRHSRPPTRPAPMVRQSSWGKRHASFDSPREIPMPPTARPTLQQRFSSQASTSSTGSASSTASSNPSSDSSPSLLVPQPTSSSDSISFLQDRLSSASLPLPSTIPARHIQSQVSPFPAPTSPPPLPRIHTPPPAVAKHPFLPSNTASTNASISLQTHSDEYVLSVRLPGFHRDSITLSTRGRRNLHILADNWEGGGHFERRISFGPDADMNGIRAEFNGTTLSIIVPRRPQSVDRSSAPATFPSHSPTGQKGASAAFLAARRPRASLNGEARPVVGSTPMAMTQSVPEGAVKGDIVPAVALNRPPRLQRNVAQIHQFVRQ